MSRVFATSRRVRRAPAAELVRLLEARHRLNAEEAPEPGQVVARLGNRSVAVALIDGQWFRRHTAQDGRNALSPLHPAGHEFSVAHSVAVELIEARAVE
ncbi:hypothetical protein [Nocardiopsis alborubida]|uniref:Uncharacterized protein n=1 Tax=Nocardiopsis alborubida TaxID=146802 RepID=A0A7X6MHN9_9ACTN|nr:hypothetical protein [Nocardiopsis alborubida]NKY99630.1 hypothetical protein [Nocardiopsis alborubida]